MLCLYTLERGMVHATLGLVAGKAAQTQALNALMEQEKGEN